MLKLKRMVKWVLPIMVLVIGFTITSVSNAYSLDFESSVSSYDTMGMIDNISTNDISLGISQSIVIEDDYDLMKYNKDFDTLSPRCKKLYIASTTLGVTGGVLAGIGAILMTSSSLIYLSENGNPSEYKKITSERLRLAGWVFMGTGIALLVPCMIVALVLNFSCDSSSEEEFNNKNKPNNNDNENDNENEPNKGEFVLGINPSGGLTVGYRF